MCRSGRFIEVSASLRPRAGHEGSDHVLFRRCEQCSKISGVISALERQRGFSRRGEIFHCVVVPLHSDADDEIIKLLQAQSPPQLRSGIAPDRLRSRPIAALRMEIFVIAIQSQKKTVIRSDGAETRRYLRSRAARPRISERVRDAFVKP